MSLLKAKTSSGREIEFHDQPIASGGEKTVFFTKNKQEVLCFYSASLGDRAERRNRLDKIIKHYNPTAGNAGDYWKSHFCWPTDLVDGQSFPRNFLTTHGLLDPALAVLAPTYRPNFFFTDTTGNRREKNGKWFTSEKPRRLLPPEEKGTFLNYLQVCAKMARAVRRMHAAGLAHSDLSNNNVLIDPRNGDACIIDIDSLVVPQIAPPTVDGTPGYIAPEVISGKGKPCIETDLHALGVLIYESLLLRHPLRGRKFHSRSAEEDERLALGERALFIEHPTDRSNAPADSISVPAKRLGPYLDELLFGVFVTGLHNHTMRPVASRWEKALYRTFDLLHPSPGGGQWFVLAPGMPFECPFIRKSLRSVVPYTWFYHENKPGHWVKENHSLTIWNGLRLMKWHTMDHSSPDENAERTPEGYFVLQNDRWWLVNESPDSWQIVHGNRVPPGQSVELIPELQLLVGPRPGGRLLLFGMMRPT